MAKLTSTGIVFGDNTALNSKYGIVPQSSSALFLQASAPTGWTKSTAHTDKALRVVSGNGGGFGGSVSFSSAFPNGIRTVAVPAVPISGSVGNHTLTVDQLPSHAHSTPNALCLSLGGGDVQNSPGWTRSFPGWSGAGGGQAHAHPWSGSFDFSVSLDFRVQFVDCLICSFA